MSMPRIRPTGAALVAGAMIGAVALAGCGAGQITQTSTQVSAVSGASGNAGQLGVRNVAIAFPEQPPKTAAVYPRGGDAPLQMTITNAGAAPDRLVSGSSPGASPVHNSGPRRHTGGQGGVVSGQAAPAPPATPAPLGRPGGPPPTRAPRGCAPRGAPPSAAPAARSAPGPGPTAAAAPGTAVVPSGTALPPLPTPAATGEPNRQATQPSLAPTTGVGG